MKKPVNASIKTKHDPPFLHTCKFDFLKTGKAGPKPSKISLNYIKDIIFNLF